MADADPARIFPLNFKGKIGRHEAPQFPVIATNAEHDGGAAMSALPETTRASNVAEHRRHGIYVTGAAVVRDRGRGRT